ncbi:response regulator [Candidatus Peregrinibacteria bacterium]|nr:response regulator [Candidatus Peregrinibacteria bacterium]
MDTPTPKKILIAEDDTFLAKVYNVKLAQKGIQTTFVKDGQEALTAMKANKPNLVLLDLIMPNKGGFETLQEMKADPELKDIPVIILSNLGQDEDVQKGKELGAVDYFIKSDISLDNITEIIKKYL